MIAPGFRWRRSRWGQLCPVALHGGSNVTGKPEFSVMSGEMIFVEKAVRRSVFLCIWHCILNADSTKLTPPVLLFSDFVGWVLNHS